MSVTSICILGARTGSAPAEVKCFVNRGEDLDFATAAEAPPTQRFELSEALDSRLEYPTEARKWQGVHSGTCELRAAATGQRVTFCWI